MHLCYMKLWFTYFYCCIRFQHLKTFYLCLLLVIDTWVVSMVRWVFLLLSYATCQGQITWQKLLGYWGETIRLPDLSYHRLLYLTGNRNAHLIIRLKDIVLMLICNRNICFAFHAGRNTCMLTCQMKALILNVFQTYRLPEFWGYFALRLLK